MQLSQILAPKACLSNGSQRSKTLLRTRTTALKYSTVCWFSWIASACPGRGRIHSRAVLLHSLRFTLPINSCVIRPSHILPSLPPAAVPQDYPAFPNSNLRPPYIISLQLSPLLNPFPPPTIQISPHVSHYPRTTLFRALHNFLLNAPICSYFFLFLNARSVWVNLGPGTAAVQARPAGCSVVIRCVHDVGVIAGLRCYGAVLKM
jgi:hypothetical protein